MKTGIGVVQRKDGSLTTTDEETANVLNEAFHGVFQKETSTTKSDHESYTDSSSITLHTDITDDEILRSMAELDESKQLGQNRFHPHSSRDAHRNC